MTTENAEKDISDIVGALTDPIIVFPGGWGDTPPEWLKNTIPLERLAMSMKALKREEMTGTDTEACAYLYTVSLIQPLTTTGHKSTVSSPPKLCAVIERRRYHKISRWRN